MMASIDSNNNVPNGTSTNAPAVGMIYPPPDIRNIVDKTALFVAKHGVQFEDRIRQRELNNPKFCFLSPNDPYYAYYHSKVRSFREQIAEQEEKTTKKAGQDEDGEGEQGDGENDRLSREDSAGKANGITPANDDTGYGIMQTVESQVLPTPVVPVREPTPAPVEPPPFDFLLDLPVLSRQDLDVMKLTALFVARGGRPLLASLQSRENRNSQFDFLRPNHSLFHIFTKLVDQYAKILLPSAASLSHLRQVKNEPHNFLARIKQRVRYTQHKAKEQKRMEEAQEAERIAFNSIDWHDFVVTETVEFGPGDEKVQLPPPVTVMELQSLTLVQKKQALMDIEDNPADVAQDGSGQPMQGNTQSQAPADEAMDLEAPDADKGSARPQPETLGPMKIRLDYVPKSHSKKPQQSEPTQVCPRCGQAIPVSEMQEHMRIELLDPTWREQKAAHLAKQGDSNLLQVGSDVSNALKQFAQYRTDIFGSDEVEIGRKVGEEARNKAAEREKVIWDGHLSSVASATQRAQASGEDQIQDAPQGLMPGVAMNPSVQQLGVPQQVMGMSVPLPVRPGIAPGQQAHGVQPPVYAVSQGGLPVTMAQQMVSVAGLVPGMPPRSMPGMVLPGQPSVPVQVPYNVVSAPPGTFVPAMAPHLALGSASAMAGMNAAGLQQNVALPGVPGYRPPGMTAGVPGAPFHPGQATAVDGSGGQSVPAPQSQPTSRGGTIRPAEGPPDLANVGGDEKRAKTDHFIPEDEWLLQHPGEIAIKIQVPSQESGGAWQLSGQVLTLPSVDPMTSVAGLKDMITAQISLPANKQRLQIDSDDLSGDAGGTFLKNGMSLASYNMSDGDRLVLSVKERGRKR